MNNGASGETPTGVAQHLGQVMNCDGRQAADGEPLLQVLALPAKRVERVRDLIEDLVGGLTRRPITFS